jgi:prevent-host-death family protein
MADVSVRDLRNNGGRVLQRVAKGESLIITLDGEPVAELRPLASRALSAPALLKRWRGLPRINAMRLRADLDRILDSKL